MNLESYFQQNSIIVVQWRTKSCPKRNYPPLPPSISQFLISEVSKWKTTSSLYQWHRKRNLSINEEAQCSFCAHEINVKWLRPLRRVEEHSLFKNWSESWVKLLTLYISFKTPTLNVQFVLYCAVYWLRLSNASVNRTISQTGTANFKNRHRKF